jgi:hypothetical protein
MPISLKDKDVIRITLNISFMSTSNNFNTSLTQVFTICRRNTYITPGTNSPPEDLYNLSGDTSDGLQEFNASRVSTAFTGIRTEGIVAGYSGVPVSLHCSTIDKPGRGTWYYTVWIRTEPSDPVDYTLGGTQSRPNINIKDMIRVYKFFLNNNCKGTFNIGFENYTINKIAKIIIKTLNNKKIKIKRLRSNDVRSYRLDSSKILKLGFKPKYTIKDAIKELLENFNKKKLFLQKNSLRVNFLKSFLLKK